MFFLLEMVAKMVIRAHQMDSLTIGTLLGLGLLIKLENRHIMMKVALAKWLPLTPLMEMFKAMTWYYCFFTSLIVLLINFINYCYR